MKFAYNDGGRNDAGFKGTTGDCVVRAIAIAAELPYKDVYKELKDRMGKGSSPRKGVPRTIFAPYLSELGFTWVPTAGIGKKILRFTDQNFPSGRLVVRLSKHLTAAIDGVVNDIYDPTRSGTRKIYGYWVKM